MKQKNTLQWLYTVPGKKKGYIVALTLLQSASGGAGVLYALLLRNIVDSAAARELTSFWRYVVCLAALVLLLLGNDIIINRLHEKARSDIENLFKERLMSTLLRKAYAAVSAVPSGEWMTRLTSDTMVVADSYVDLLPGLAGMFIRLTCALIMIIALAPWFACILIPGGVLLIFSTWIFRKVLKRLHKNVQESKGRLHTFLQERIDSLQIIKAFSAETQTSAGAGEKMQDHRAARMKRNAFSIFCGTGFSAAMQGMYLLGVVYCAYGILSGTITFGTLTAVMQLIAQVQAPFARLSGFGSRFYAMTASAERLMEAENYPDDCADPVIDAPQIQTYYRDRFEAIVLQNVDFTYPLPTGADAKPQETAPVVLRDLNLKIQKGEYVAFTGHSGCGKSTVLKLLMSLYPPDSGELLLLGKDGTVPLTSKWRRLFAFVPQGNAIMSGKIRDVVAFACPERSNDDQKLMKALATACADEFVQELEQGLDTPLGENGAGLSEGQMQRLAIARALFTDAPVLLLDESTSALDEETEKRLLHNLRSLTDKTVIIVTHRKAVLSICDQVFAFDE